MSPATSEALRTLAHPLRSRLLAELRVHGGATATELAAALDTNTGATSYHLRRLEEAGLVEDTGTGSGRRRVWSAVPDEDRPGVLGVGLGVAGGTDDDLDEDDARAADWLALDYLAHFGERFVVPTTHVEKTASAPFVERGFAGFDDLALGDELVVGIDHRAARGTLIHD